MNFSLKYNVYDSVMRLRRSMMRSWWNMKSVALQALTPQQAAARNVNN